MRSLEALAFFQQHVQALPPLLDKPASDFRQMLFARGRH